MPCNFTWRGGDIFFLPPLPTNCHLINYTTNSRGKRKKKIKIKKNQGQGGKLFILRRPKTGNENCSNATNEGELSKGKTARKSGSCIGD